MKRKSLWRPLLGVSAAAFVTGCGWFGGNDAAPVVKARPGADRQLAPTGTLPAPPGHRLEQGIAPTDEPTPQIGSIVNAKGGQRAQKEAAEKAIIEREAKEREARDAARRDAGAGEHPVPLPADAPATPAPTTPKS